VGLSVERIRLADFRNYESREFEIGPELTIAEGPNAAGKTTIIEALELTTAGTSFKQPSWRDVVRWGAAECRVAMRATGDGREYSIEMTVTPQGKRQYAVNGSRARRVADIRGNVPSVVFTPDDLGIVKGSAEKRRGSIDSLGDQLSATYEALRREYELTVRQRNAALKERAEGVVEALTESLVDTGAKYAEHRIRLLERVSAPAREIHDTVSGGESLEIEYVSSWGPVPEEDGPHRTGLIAERLRETLAGKKREEYARGITLTGPHRDDVSFLVGGRSARDFASQGQQRSVALAWKLAEVRAVEEIAGAEPVLLLDDVMSELDEARRTALTAFVGGSVQTVVTTTNMGYFDPEMLGRASIIHLAR
jgi:DNA replication and repair protein RecF